MGKEREAIILGALLHDIGKFAQRAEEDPKKDKHTNWGRKWFEDNISEELQPVFGKEKEIIEKAIGNHHDYEEFITLADAISAGIDRIEITEEEEKDPFTTPLKSIFSNIFDKNLNRFNKLTKLQDKGSIFPSDQNKCFFKDYKSLLEEFNKEIKNLDLKNFTPDEIIEIIYHLLYKYTSFIPSASYIYEPDISLFEHLKTTAAFATCLYDYKNNKGDDKNEFVLLHCDLSGIQNFIYSVSSEKALKGLRGRSLYLELLLETIARKILDEFDLTICNILFFGGGNFNLILPNVKNIKEKIENISKEVQEEIFKYHKTNLGVVISYIFLSFNDLKKENYQNTMDKLSDAVSKEKKKKYKEILDYKNFFEPFGGDKIELKGCEICGEEILTGDKCSFCESFEDLSIKIKEAKYLKISKIKNKKQTEDKKWYTLLEALGWEYFFGDDSNKLNRGKIYKINDVNFSKDKCIGFKYCPILSPSGTLEDMAEKAEGIKKWGALRMDVDNLGKIFKEGIKVKTISRYNMLSKALSLFFSIAVKEIVKEKGQDICIVYSGGDDLFILAPWNKLPEIAYEIRNEFKKYVCENTEINISGGIYIAPSKKFPVYEAAKEAGEAEEKAKKEDKNKITFLDTPIEWVYFKNIEEAKDKIYELIKEKDIPKSILQILYFGYEEEELLKGKKISIPRIWRLFYAFKRLIQRKKEFSNELEDLKNKFIIDYKMSPKLNVSVKWAELLTRKEE